MDLSSKELDTIAVENFRRYLRIPSVHPDIDYEPCVEFLETQAKDIGLQFRVFRDVPKNPMVVLTWPGKERSLPSVMLNSHMDVVPVFEENWTHRPFDADIDEKGDIYARGAQDTKSTGIQYLEAIRRLKIQGVRPRRTVHVTFVPDEELGGGEGVMKYVETDNFKGLKVGFAIDEGRSGNGKTLVVQYGEKRNWKFAVHCPGKSGHGSLLLKNTPGEKLRAILNKLYAFRAEQKAKEDREKSGDHVTTVNLTIMRGGVQGNVIPEEFVLVFDLRIPVEDYDSVEGRVKEWCKSAGEGVWIEDILKDGDSPNTATDESNVFWVAFNEASKKMGYEIQLIIARGNTDGRFLRSVGIPTFGFGAKQDTPIRAHADDEFLNVDVFLQGIQIYKEIIIAVANA
ncbi:hypothetical protein PPYR_11581 [Photinus pyralis]|uniref:N-acyl-aliphatic-L-amino acid amidohydrolase n=2 Tax=Photinus pyralis TaxID=7054 RepID=A0A5N4A244_PHOPY|nr:aminoacylase-1-like [Photinus pyralis]XP_031331269.1 aminoacylase-1-like [Photinus pyralis]XP_031351152.1 aminoacylase-1-like [Photinus pyralis]KAB0791317.1 hypothetical protein PPYR_03117 [Photinus pyralis]KAB0791395.1 hypothetical protein PPYR_03195 [Photinus pyralis]KAB0794742.1 hypothetical protein PPYR_11581 [Photinus pyralis]